jgi:rhodanese-related sulfurtransferase
VKANTLLLAAFFLCLSFAGCKSSSQTAADAATSDTSAAPDVAQPDDAPDGIGASGDVATSPADSLPEVDKQDIASAGIADVTASDGQDEDASVANDLVKDAAADLSAPTVDLSADLPATDGPGADGPSSETRSDAGCTGWNTLKRLSPAEVSDLIATSNPIVINVHIPYAGDIPGTDTSIPYNDVDAIEAYLNYDHCADVLLVCMSGGMSQSAGNELIKRGYLRVRDLNGGMQAWQAAGYPLLKDGGP